jgi:pimeloyl-ACP methyl ester carboxylesterase
VILQHGNGGNKNDLRSIEAFLAGRTQVCAYDRPGAVDGRSDVPSNLPRPVTNLVSEAHDVLVAAEIEPPYFVFGFSAGAMIAFMFAQAYPDETVGFVAINPVPPYTAWIEEATKVQTPEELEREEADYRGSNPESIDYTANDGMLNDSLPATMPYAVMFDEDCGGDTEFCGRVLEPLAATTELLTDVSEGGRFQWVKGAGHDIDLTRPEEVKQTIDEIWAEAVD